MSQGGRLWNRRIRKGRVSAVSYKVNLDEFFANPQVIDLDNHLAVGNGKMAADLADNYMDMFTIDKIEN